jgi:hypothetical protein
MRHVRFKNMRSHFACRKHIPQPVLAACSPASKGIRHIVKAALPLPFPNPQSRHWLDTPPIVSTICKHSEHTIVRAVRGTTGGVPLAPGRSRGGGGREPPKLTGCRTLDTDQPTPTPPNPANPEPRGGGEVSQKSEAPVGTACVVRVLCRTTWAAGPAGSGQGRGRPGTGSLALS